MNKIKHGNLFLSPRDDREIKEWVEFENLVGTDVSSYSTTMNGVQYAFGPGDKQPRWHKVILDQIPPFDFSRIKSSWVVSYDIGGYQEQHLHASSDGTLIVNMIGNGIICLHEETITEKHLTPGDWIYIPGKIIHSTKPCETERIVLVIDFKL